MFEQVTAVLVMVLWDHHTWIQEAQAVELPICQITLRRCLFHLIVLQTLPTA